MPTSRPHGIRFACAIGMLCIVNFLVAIDTTILSVALPKVSEELNGSAVEAAWAGTSYLLAATVLQPWIAALSDVFGRKTMLSCGIALFAAGSTAAGAAQNFTTLLAGRTVQGIGGGAFSALTNVLLTDMVPLRDRAKWLSFIMIFWAFGCAIAPVIGGALTEHVSWRWIYWINLPICGAASALLPAFPKLQPQLADLSLAEKLRRVDWIGSALFVASTSSFLIPVSWGGSMYPWTHWRTLTPLLLGVVGNVVFAFYETRVTAPKNPMLPPAIFGNRTAIVCFYGMVVQGLAMATVTYYIPIFFEACKGWSPTKAGVGLFPWTFTSPPSSMLIGALISHYGTYRWAIRFGWVLVAAGAGILVLYKPWTPASEWIPFALVSGIGIGFVYPPLSICNQAAVDDVRHVAAAAALTSFWRNYGQMLGIAIGGNVLQNRLRVELEKAGPAVAAHAGELSRDAMSFVAEVRRMDRPIDAITKRIYIWAFSESLHYVWYVVCAFSGLAFVLSIFFTKHYSLEREEDVTLDEKDLKYPPCPPTSSSTMSCA